MVNPQLLLCMTSLIGIIPAIIVMYYILRSYDEYFKDTWLYGFLAGGLIMGMVFFVVHAFLDPYALKYSIDMALLLFVFAFAVLEELAKYALLYYKKFLGNHETTYYGLTLGLGFGASAIISTAYQEFLHDPGLVVEQPLVLPTAILLSVGFVGLHGTTGAMIGFGSAKKYKWRFLGWALLLHVLFNLVLLVFRWTSYPLKFVEVIVLACIGLAGLYYIRTEIMPASLTSKMARKRRREMRKRRWQKGTGRMKKGKGKVTWESKGLTKEEE